MKPKIKKVKKRMEFSQKLVVVSWVVTVIWIFLSYILAFFDKNTNEMVTVTLITESLGVTLAYFCYQAILKTSRNKNGVDENGIPYKIKSKLDLGDIDSNDGYNDNDMEA